MKTTSLLAVGITLSLSAFAQAQTTTVVETKGPHHTYRVVVISREVQAVNYRHRSGSTKVDFAGTDLMRSANGVAEVNSKKGAIQIDAEFSNLERPRSLGNEYLTYVLWAISPEGRSVNLGEVLVGDDHRSKVQVTTDLQAFALVVTAEPY
ncbi:MAG TPA: OmpA family protein, partial [Candidatus Angelobacter sp.]|nr:OmpA family protein [Candidatus Angelobacter sp.]